MFEITSRKAEPVEAKADFGLEDLFGLTGEELDCLYRILRKLCQKR